MSKERILVVEDEEDILALVHYNLMKAGFIVDTAVSGEGSMFTISLPAFPIHGGPNNGTV